MTQYQSPINALLSQLPQFAMQMYGASREDKYRDKELEFQKANTAFSQNMQNENLAIAQGNAEQNRLNAVAQRNLYASQQAEADRNFKNADLSRVLFGNGTDALPDEYSDMDTDNDKIVDLGESNNYTLLQELLAKNAQIDASEATMNLANSKNTEYLNTADNRKRLTELDIGAKETAQEMADLQLGSVRRQVTQAGVYNDIAGAFPNIPGADAELEVNLFKDPFKENLMRTIQTAGITSAGVAGAGALGAGAGVALPAIPLAAASFLGASLLKTNKVNPDAINKILSNKQNVIAGWAKDMGVKPKEMGMFRDAASKYFDTRLGETFQEMAPGFTKRQRSLLSQYLEGTAYDYNKIGTSYPSGYQMNTGQLPPMPGQ